MRVIFKYDHDRLKRRQLTLASLLSKSLAMSASDGKPPAVTSDANVNVQYDSLLFDGAMVVTTEWSIDSNDT
jgi:hypothetical protein